MSAGDKEDRVQFGNAVKSNGERFAAESLFIAWILLQQRMINNGGGQTAFYAEGQGVLMIKDGTETATWIGRGIAHINGQKRIDRVSVF
jgi:hypothetical protein